MYHPTTRLLTVLELLQTHAHLSGDELARRLEVEPRTVRRYVMMLQELGMPIEGMRGPGGGYRLRRGFKLPPLLFTEEEATTIVLSLLGTPWLGIDLSGMAVEGALAKVYRILPLQGRERLQSLSEHTLISPLPDRVRPDVSLLVKIHEATQEQRRIEISYNSYHNQPTQRRIEPYGITGWRGNWYVVGYCCMRQGLRTFRLDRIDHVQFLTETFTRPDDFDCLDYVVKHLTSIPNKWSVEVEFQAELYTVQQKIPSTTGILTKTETGALLQTHHNDLIAMARYLVSLDIPFIIHSPVELRTAMTQLAQQIVQMANMAANS